MITESADGTIRYTDSSGKQVALSIFDDATKYAAASKRISEQGDGNSRNQTNVNNYNGLVANIQASINAGEQVMGGIPIPQVILNMPPPPLMEVWPDDPAVPMHTQPFPAGTLLVPKPAANVLPSSGGLGPDNPNRSATPLDPALASRFDALTAALVKLYQAVLTIPGVKAS